MSTLKYKVRFTSKVKSEPVNWDPLEHEDLLEVLDTLNEAEEYEDTLDFQELTEKLLDGDFLAKWRLEVLHVCFEEKTYSELQEEVYNLQSKLDDIQQYVYDAHDYLRDLDSLLYDIDTNSQY